VKVAISVPVADVAAPPPPRRFSVSPIQATTTAAKTNASSVLFFSQNGAVSTFFGGLICAGLTFLLGEPEDRVRLCANLDTSGHSTRDPYHAIHTRTAKMWRSLCAPTLARSTSDPRASCAGPASSPSPISSEVADRASSGLFAAAAEPLLINSSIGTVLANGKQRTVYWPPQQAAQGK